MKITRKPEWLRMDLACGNNYTKTKSTLKGINTVCESAKCPNRAKCWSKSTATFMILGNNCTRNCKFCAISHNKPEKPDELEAQKIANAVKEMNLKYVVLTSVTRDDLSDGGSSHWANVVNTIKNVNPQINIEVLTPDFNGNKCDIDKVLDTPIHVFAHNLETVARLQKQIRIKASYEVSLNVLRYASSKGKNVKSGLMLGLGEDEEEVRQAIYDIRQTGATSISIGQYMQASKNNIKVSRWVEPEEFDKYAEYAKNLGFKFIKSAPFVRSSFEASDTTL